MAAASVDQSTKSYAFLFDINKRDIGNSAVVNAVTLDPTTFQIVDPYTQIFSTPFRFLRLSPRVDYKITPKQSLMFRYGYTKNDYDHYGVGSFNLVSRGANAHLREQAIQVTETAILSPKVISETQFFSSTNTIRIRPIPPIRRSKSRTPSVAAPIPKHCRPIPTHHYQVQNITTVAEKSHTIRFGVWLRTVALTDTSQENFMRRLASWSRICFWNCRGLIAVDARK